MSDISKKYYKINDVAEILHIPESTLRYWEKRFSIIKPHRSEGGRRLYTPDDIEKIRMVYYLVKERGLKLEAAEEQIRLNRSGVSRRYVAIERLRSIRAQLSALLAAIDSNGA